MPIGLGILLMGPSGQGKTSTISHIPGETEFVSVGNETGFDDLNQVGLVKPGIKSTRAKSYAELLYVVNNFKLENLIIDHASTMQDLIFRHSITVDFNGDMAKFDDYSKGKRSFAPKYVVPILDKLTEHRMNGKNVVLIGHTFVETIKNPLGADYWSNVLALDQGDDKGLRHHVMNWSHNVLFMNWGIDINRVTEVNKEKMVMEGKAGGASRLLYTTSQPGIMAKNRMGLPPVIHLGESAKEAFDNFWKHVPDVFKKQVPPPKA